MINVICDMESWAEVLQRIPEKHRFSDPSQYDQDLIDRHGRPMLIRVGDTKNGFDMHLYPPYLGQYNIKKGE